MAVTPVSIRALSQESLQAFAIAKRTQSMDGRRLFVTREGIRFDRVGIIDRILAFFGCGRAALKNVIASCANWKITVPELNALGVRYNQTHCRIKQVAAQILIPQEERKEKMQSYVSNANIEELNTLRPTPEELHGTLEALALDEFAIAELLGKAINSPHTLLANSLIFAIPADKTGAFFLDDGADSGPNVYNQILLQKDKKKELAAALERRITENTIKEQFEGFLSRESRNAHVANFLLGKVKEETLTAQEVCLVAKWAAYNDEPATMEAYLVRLKDATALLQFYNSLDQAQVGQASRPILDKIVSDRCSPLKMDWNDLGYNAAKRRDYLQNIPPHLAGEWLSQSVTIYTKKQTLLHLDSWWDEFVLKEKLKELWTHIPVEKRSQIRSQKDQEGNTPVHAACACTTSLLDIYFDGCSSDEVYAAICVKNQRGDTPFLRLRESPGQVLHIFERLEARHIFELAKVAPPVNLGYSVMHSFAYNTDSKILLNTISVFRHIGTKLDDEQFFELLALRDQTSPPTTPLLELVKRGDLSVIHEVIDRIPPKHALLQQKYGGLSLLDVRDVPRGDTVAQSEWNSLRTKIQQKMV